MNQHDLDNLSFLLSLDKAGFSAWFSQASLDDIEYAFEIFKELLETTDELIKTLQECVNNEIMHDIESLKEAQDYLQKFRL